MTEFKTARNGCKANIEKVKKNQKILIKTLTQGFSILSKSMIKLTNDLSNKQTESYDAKLKKLEDKINIQDAAITSLKNEVKSYKDRKNIQGQSQPTTTVNPIIDNTPINPANPKTSNSKIPPVSKNPIPPLIIDQNNVINESMSYAFTVVKSKPKRAPGLTFNDEQNEHVKSAVKK